jgi:thiopurine S-methyltransferase
METSVWHERWAKNELGWHERDVNPLLTKHLRHLGLPAGSRVFVPLCGKTRDIAWLLQQGYAVAGSELSELAVQQLLAELGVQPAVTQVGTLKRYSAPGLDVFAGDIFELRAAELGPVAATYDRAALVALPPAMRNRYAQHLIALTAGAPQLLICFEYDQNLMAGPPHSVTAVEVWRQYGAAYRLSLVHAQTLPEGIRGTPANELVWLLQRKPDAT